MPDFITPAERAAIAAYTGPVQIIPRGVSGLPPELPGIDYKIQNRNLWAESAARGRARAAYLRRLENNQATGA